MNLLNIDNINVVNAAGQCTSLHHITVMETIENII